MKTFNQFIVEARNAAGVLGALSRASKRKQNYSGKEEEGIAKYNELKTKEADLDKKPGSETGKYAKEYTKIDKQKIKILTDYNLKANDPRLR